MSCGSESDRVYKTLNFPVENTNTYLTGIRGNNNLVYISGFYSTSDQTSGAFIYKGDIIGDGSWNILAYPDAKTTNLYGPDILKNGNIRAVGNYNNNNDIGCIYEGPLDNSGKWTSVAPPIALNTILHSTMGDLVVGNYDTSDEPNKEKGFIYNIKTNKYYYIEKPGAKIISAYGIWWNGCNDYTIAGGFSNHDAASGVSLAYLVDWNNKHHKFNNWREYSYDNKLTTLSTHFDGITTDDNNGYYLTGGTLLPNSTSETAFIAHVGRHCDGRFTRTKWNPILYPGSSTTTGNSIYRRSVIGVYATPTSTTSNGYTSFIAI